MKKFNTFCMASFLLAASIISIPAASAQKPASENKQKAKYVLRENVTIEAINEESIRSGGAIEEKYPDENQYVAVKSEATTDMQELQKKITYPEEGLRAKAEGRTIVKVLVNKEGVPVRAKIHKSDHKMFEKCSLEAIMNSQFTPAMDNEGNPISSWVYVPVNFKCK